MEEELYGWNSKGNVDGIIFSCPEEPHMDCKEKECSFAVCKITKIIRQNYKAQKTSNMSKRKVIAYKTIVANRTEDYDSNAEANEHRRLRNIVNSLEKEPKPDMELLPPNIVKGLDSKANDLIADGFEPYGEVRITYSPTYVFPGTATTLGGYPLYHQQFVKYEP